MVCVFFFSSRRRHTRYWRDWSSDVCSSDLQELAGTEWPDGVAVSVRMGLHTGEAVLDGARYVGLEVHRAARIAAAAHGGQVLLSAATRAVVDRKSTRLNSSHANISYAVFCLKKKKNNLCHIIIP